MSKQRYVKLQPELCDGEHWCHNNNRCEIGDAIAEWILNRSVGSKVTLEIIELTDDEVEALPSI